MLHLCYVPTPSLKQGHQDKHDPLCPERGPAEEEGGYDHNEHADDGSDSLTVGFFRVAVLALAGGGTSGHSVAVEGQTDLGRALVERNGAPGRLGQEAIFPRKVIHLCEKSPWGS